MTDWHYRTYRETEKDGTEWINVYQTLHDEAGNPILRQGPQMLTHENGPTVVAVNGVDMLMVLLNPVLDPNDVPVEKED